jgi:Fe-S-cluster containining protein
MLAPPGSQADGDLFFDPRSKCCTYEPSLPNFLVGRILRDRSPESAAGRASVEARIAAGIGVTPAGLAQSAAYGLRYRSAPDAFGRSVALRCPHYRTDTGTCGIWRHRESACATWFCKYDRGAVGLRFWTALRRLLESVERALVAHCLLTLDPGAGVLERIVASTGPDAEPRLSAADLDEVADARRQRLAWGRYAGREREFYEASARLVEHLTWTEVTRLAGAEVQLAAALVKATYDALRSDALPSRLRAAPVEIVHLGAGRLRMTSYRAYDPLVIPKALGDALHHFDGRPTRSALAAIASDTGLDIERAVVRRLVDFDVLVEDPAEPPE